MSYDYKLSRRAMKGLKKLNPRLRARIIAKLDWICERGEPRRFAKKLVDFELGEFRLRVGDWRVIFDIDEENEVLKILEVDHRKNIYR